MGEVELSVALTRKLPVWPHIYICFSHVQTPNKGNVEKEGEKEEETGTAHSSSSHSAR